jgi:hypothetical protein
MVFGDIDHGIKKFSVLIRASAAKKLTNRNDENKNIVNPDLYKLNAIVLCAAAYRLYGR